MLKRKNANIRLHIWVLIVILCVFRGQLIPIKCGAEELGSDVLEAGIDEILDDFYDSIPENVTSVADKDNINDALGVKHILEIITNTVKDNSGDISVFLLTVVGVGLMGALASLYDGDVSVLSSGAVGIVCAALLFDKLSDLLYGTVRTIGDINSFFGAVIPVSLAVNSLGASPTTASTQALGMGLTLGAYSFIAEALLKGVVGAIFLTSALSGLDPMLARMSHSVKNIFTRGLGVITLLLGATFAFQSTISASTDSLAVRGAKYAISSAIPMVGGAVSGALGIVEGSISYARGIVGAGAVAVILSLVISPLVILLLYRTCMQIGAFIVSRCSLGCEGVISSFIGALDSLIAVYALTAVIYVVELAAFMKGGVRLA